MEVPSAVNCDTMLCSCKGEEFRYKKTIQGGKEETLLELVADTLEGDWEILSSG